MGRALLLLASFAGSSLFGASVTYTYTGNPFTTVVGNVPSGSFLTISITLSSALMANQTDQVVTPTAWSISDGVAADLLTNSNHSYTFQGFEFATDAAGNITKWAVGANTGSSFAASWTANQWSVFGGVTTLDEYYEDTLVSLNQQQPGKWVVAAAATSTPEPGTAFLMVPVFAFGLLYRGIRSRWTKTVLSTARSAG